MTMASARYEVNAVKKRFGKDPLEFNLSIYEENMPVFREVIKDLGTKGWKITTLRETYLPWDINES